MKETHARGLKLAVLKEDKEKAVTTSPTHLKKASLDDFRLVAVNGEVHLARLTEGVLQWLGEDLQSHEQIMLPYGQELADYVAESPSAGWALQKEAPYIHRIKIDESRLSESVERIKVIGATTLVRDAVLGLLLVDHDVITHLSEGHSRELTLRDVVDQRVNREGGIRDTKFHRLASTDIDADGKDDLILFDDLQHRITVLSDREGELRPRISWPVFDDKVYPYEDDSEELVREPRAVVAADVDGDGFQDFAMLCHDRLIIYLAHE